MLDHISLTVGDFTRARDFYDAALGALGHARVMTFEEADYVAAGYGANEHEPAFWIGAGTGPGCDQPTNPPEGQHVAFRAPNRRAVDAFHAAGLAAGGHDNGGPGIRPHYHPNYYAAFVIDPDGNHLEAVCHTPG